MPTVNCYHLPMEKHTDEISHHPAGNWNPTFLRTVLLGHDRTLHINRPVLRPTATLSLRDHLISLCQRGYCKHNSTTKSLRHWTNKWQWLQFYNGHGKESIIKLGIRNNPKAFVSISLTNRYQGRPSKNWDSGFEFNSYNFKPWNRNRPSAETKPLLLMMMIIIIIMDI
jgi:hypothetical protein